MMYSVSSAFHTALQTGAPQKALLVFADAVFSNTDIAANGGIEFSEPFCAQTDLTIGLCPSATLTASLLNPDGALDTFGFGEFTGYIGPRIAQGVYAPVEGALATLPINAQVSISIHADAPYVRENGQAATEQPPFAPKAIVALEDKIYVISIDGEFFRYTYASTYTWASVSTTRWKEISGRTWSDIAAETWDDATAYQWTDFTNKYVPWSTYAPSLMQGKAITVNAFMTAKGKTWAAESFSGMFSGNILTLFGQDATTDVYEMCPLGVFYATRPATRRKIVVKFTAFDKMEKFDVEAAAWLAGLAYPLTLGQIFASLCAFVGVTPATTTFLNSTHSYSAAPFSATSVTARMILQYIAEAACAIARCDREGKLKLDWFAAADYQLTNNEILSIEIAEYETAPVDKLQVQVQTSDVGVVIGTGENTYVLLASPFVTGSSDAEIRAFASPIYTRLAAFSAYPPLSVRHTGDWAVQAGDIITTVYDGETFLFPVFKCSLTWRGTARATWSSSGGKTRDTNAVTNRESFVSTQSRLSIEKNVGELTVEVASKVGVSEIISRINLTPEEIKIQSGKITLEGYTTVNNYFKINLDGSFEAVAGKIGRWNVGSTSLYYGTNTEETAPTYYIGNADILKATAIAGSAVKKNWRLKIGTTFGVDAAGALYATSGNFLGNVRAGNVQYGGANGTFDGNGITTQTISGGSGGQIGSSTITGDNMEPAYDVLKADVATLNSLVSGSATIGYLRVLTLQYNGLDVVWGLVSTPSGTRYALVEKL